MRSLRSKTKINRIMIEAEATASVVAGPIERTASKCSQPISERAARLSSFRGSPRNHHASTAALSTS